jgi:hypothetical protein
MNGVHAGIVLAGDHPSYLRSQATDGFTRRINDVPLAIFGQAFRARKISTHKYPHCQLFSPKSELIEYPTELLRSSSDAVFTGFP